MTMEAFSEEVPYKPNFQQKVIFNQKRKEMSFFSRMYRNPDSRTIFKTSHIGNALHLFHSPFQPLSPLVITNLFPVSEFFSVSVLVFCFVLFLI